MYNISERRPLVFVHFPKAGGVSILRQLQAVLGPSLLQDNDHDPFGESAFHASVSLDRGVQAVFGHFLPDRYSAIPNALRCTFLRHPVQNLISIYFFWRTLPPSGNPIHERFLREAPTIEEFAEFFGLDKMMSRTFFGNYDMSRFDFIGFHETRSQDMERLSLLLGFTVNARVHENRTPHYDERAMLLADDRRMRHIADLLSDDVAFYEHLRGGRASGAGYVA